MIIDLIDIPCFFFFLINIYTDPFVFSKFIVFQLSHNSFKFVLSTFCNNILNLKKNY